MSASFDVRDWIGWGAERNDPAWKSKATNWFNELTRYVREVRADLDTDVAALEAHKETADWADGGLTFSRDATNSSTRISDIYSATRQVFFGAVRVTIDSLASKTEYMDNGATVIGQWSRGDGYFRLLRVPSATPAFASGWANHSAAQALLTVRKDSDGFVHMQGRVSNISGATKPSGSTVATIPAFYRPARTNTFVGKTSTGGSGGFVQFNVQADGGLRFFNANGASGGIANGEWLTLSATWFVGH